MKNIQKKKKKNVKRTDWDFEPTVQESLYNQDDMEMKIWSTWEGKPVYVLWTQ